MLAAATASGPVSVFAAPRRWREVSPSDLAFGTFTAQVNSRFVARNGNGEAQALDLILVEPTAKANDDAVTAEKAGEQFSLIFRGEPNRPLEQSTYSFEQGRIGRFEMFIVPIGCEDRSHCYYEAVFNRLPPQKLASALREGTVPQRRTSNR